MVQPTLKPGRRESSLTPHPAPLTRKVDSLMRRTILLVATMALTVLVASGLALAVNKLGTAGPDGLRGTDKPRQPHRQGWARHAARTWRRRLLGGRYGSGLRGGWTRQ